MTHWIIAPIILPALLAPLIVLFMQHNIVLQRFFGLAGTGALLVISIILWQQAALGPQVYHLGNWPAPFGIVLVLDELSAMMLMLTAFLALVVQIYAEATGWDARGKHFHALFLFQQMGLNGAFLTGDAFNLFVFFEVMLIASYGLMIHSGGRARVQAGIQYVTFNLVGSTLFLFALATIYSVTGTLNMADLAVKVAVLPPEDFALIRVAGVLLLLVFAIKAALVPLHFWLPNTYALAPGPVAALFAVMTKVGAYGVIRLYSLVFPPDTPATGTFFADLLLPAGLVTLIVGALGVLGAKSLTRMIAFAAIGSSGTLFIAIAQFTPQATAAALYYLLHSTLTTACLFLLADLIQSRRGSDDLTKTYPPICQSGLLGALFFVSAVSMVGMPPLSGFLGKLMILEATWGQVWVWVVILSTALVMALGFARAGSQLFWKAHETGEEFVPHRPDWLAFTALFGALIALTVFAGPLSHITQDIAAALHDPAPYIAANALGVKP